MFVKKTLVPWTFARNGTFGSLINLFVDVPFAMKHNTHVQVPNVDEYQISTCPMSNARAFTYLFISLRVTETKSLLKMSQTNLIVVKLEITCHVDRNVQN